MNPVLSDAGPMLGAARRVLLIIHNPDRAGALARGFLHAGVDVTLEQELPAAVARAVNESFSVIVVDTRLEGVPGLDVVRQLQLRDVQTPVIALVYNVARDAGQATDAGAIGALRTSASALDVMQELGRYTIRSRVTTSSPRRISVADLEIDLRTRVVRRNGEQLSLTAKEFLLLELLALRAGQFVDRSTLGAYIWKDSGLGQSNQLEVLVRRLRRKLDDAFEQKLLRTRRGAGYALLHDESPLDETRALD